MKYYLKKRDSLSMKKCGLLVEAEMPVIDTSVSMAAPARQVFPGGFILERVHHHDYRERWLK